MKNYVAINSAIVAPEDAKISIYDLAIQRGYGIFDYFKTIDGEAVWLEDHLDRFYASAAAMHLPVHLERTALKQLISELMHKNKLPDSGLKMTLTGGYAEDGYTIDQPTLIITQHRFDTGAAVAAFENPLHLVRFEHQRQLAHIKTIDYLQAIRLQPFIKEQGAQDVLYFHAGEILECPRANFFIVTDNDEVLTPARHVLHGVTRKKLLENKELKVTESVITPGQLANAREAFITSTTKMVLPVVQIDGRRVGNGRPGEVTRNMRRWLLAAQGIA